MQSRYSPWKITTYFLMVSILILTDTSQAIIVFRDSHTGQSEIYIMNDDGKHVQQLNYTPLPEYNPRWSPDGKHITFVRNLGSVAEPRQLQQFDIFIMNADGSNERRLTFHPKNDGFPHGLQMANILRLQAPELDAEKFISWKLPLEILGN